MDYDLLTKSIVGSINQYAKAKADMMSLQNAFMMDEVQNRIKEKRALDLEQRKNEIISPIERMMMNKYMSENPSQVQDFVDSGSPALAGLANTQKQKMQKAGTGGKNTTSQGVNVPSTYKPPVEPAYKTVRMGARGFEDMKPAEIVGMNIIEKANKGERLSQGEKQFIGLDKEEKFVDDLKKVEAGQESIDKLETRYPDKIKEIKNYKVSKLDYKSQAIASQIQKQIEGFKVAEGDPFVLESLQSHIEDIVNQLIDDKEEAVKRGIDVDGILKALGIKEEEWEQAETTPQKKKSLLDKILRAWSN